MTNRPKPTHIEARNASNIIYLVKTQHLRCFYVQCFHSKVFQ